ncbi:MAG: hypothetical protein EBU33_09300, partial [Sphingobacteriia bacterium]|nr:hypothetical protein [Sphingobacteriia bacterium]
MFVDSSQAHALAIKHIKEWSSQGNSLHKQLTQIIRSALSAVGNSVSPAKAIKKTERELKNFFSQPPVSGAIIETHGRKLEFFLSHPDSIQDGLSFVLISGQFNGGTGACKIEVKRSLVITIHALMRLHQRIGVLNPTVVLSEIYDAVGGCSEIIKAAKEIDAKSCPILSKNGIFITAPIKNSDTTALITWISFDQLSRKWGEVVDALKEIQQSKPSLLNDEKYLIKFLASFRWIRQPHDQGADAEQATWAERATNDLVENRLDATLIDQKKLSAIEHDLTQSVDSEKAPEIGAEIDLLIQDKINSTDISSPKTNDRCHGIVVRKTATGHVIVSLCNGWFGSISPIGLEKAN